MNKGTRSRLWQLAGWLPGSLLLTACATSGNSHDVTVERPAMQGTAQGTTEVATPTTTRISADAVFDSADGDGDGRLLPPEIERLKLGGNWHTLDFDGDGAISRSEFRREFATPLIQTSMRLPSDPDNLEPPVSSDFALPPLPPTQRYVPAPISEMAPASMTVPTNAPLVIPVLIDDQDAAAIDRAAENAGDADGVDAATPDATTAPPAN